MKTVLRLRTTRGPDGMPWGRLTDEERAAVREAHEGWGELEEQVASFFWWGP